jgi:hypothetical protein
VLRKYKEAKLKDDPTWTLEKEMCIRRGTDNPVRVCLAVERHFKAQPDSTAAAAALIL